MANYIKKLFITFYIPPIFIPLSGFILGIIFIELDLVLISIISISALIFYFKNFRIWIAFLTFFTLGAVKTYLLDTEYQQFKKLEKKTTSFSGFVLNCFKTDKKHLSYVTILKIKELNLYLKIYSQKKYFHQIGDSIKIEDIELRKINEKQTLLKENDLGSVFIKQYNYKLIYRPKLSLSRWINNKKTSLNKAFSGKIKPFTYSLFCYLFSGTQSPKFKINCEIKEKFNYWGIAHYLARSGLHVVLIIILWNLFLSLFLKSFTKKQIILLILIILYHILTSPNISFMRALITFIIYKIAILSNRTSHSLNLISLTCLILLLYNPFYLFALDFQLSFILTYALSCFHEIKLLKKFNEVS